MACFSVTRRVLIICSGQVRRRLVAAEQLHREGAGRGPLSERGGGGKADWEARGGSGMRAAGAVKDGVHQGEYLVGCRAISHLLFVKAYIIVDITVLCSDKLT